MRRALQLVALVCLFTGAAFGQGVLYYDRVQAVDGRAIGGVTVTPCTYSSGQYTSGQYTGAFPCTPTVTAYYDPALTEPITPPILTDSQGNVTFFLPTGSYTITFNAPNINSRGLAITLPCSPGTGTSGCGGSTTLTSTQIGFGSSGNAVTGDQRLTFNAATGNQTVPSIEGLQYVDCANSAHRAGSDIGAWLNVATAAAAANGSGIYLAPGNCNIATQWVINKVISVSGAGPTSTNLTWTGSTSVAPIEVDALSAAPYLNGRISGFTLTCMSNGPGIHQIDTIGEIYDDLAIVGCGPKGLWFDNVAGFNERTNLGTLSMYHSGIYLTNNNTATPFPNSNSFGFGWWHGVHFQVAASQSAVTAIGCVSCGSGTNATTSGGLGVAGPYAGVSSAFIYNSGDFAISANLEASSSTLVTLSSGSALAGIRLDIDAECTGCSGATSFNIDATSVLNADISSHIAVQGLAPVTAMGAVYLPQGQITGTGVPVFSDAPFIQGPTFYCDMVPNCPSFLQLGTATSGGNFSSTKAYFNASIWNGSAPVLDQFSLFNSCAATGTNPVCTFTIGHAGSTGNNYVSIPQSLTIGSVTADPAGTIPNGSIWYRSDLGYLKCQQAGVAAQCGAGGGIILATNGVNNGSQTLLNFITSSTNADGLVVTPYNSGGTEKFEITGPLYYQTFQVGGTPVTQETTANFVAGTNMTITPSIVSGVTTLTFAASATAATAFSSLTASTNSNIGNFVIVGGNWDFSSGTWRAPTGSGYAPTTNGVFGYNSLTNLYAFGQNGSTLTLSQTQAPSSGTFLSGYNAATGAFSTASNAATATLAATATAAATTPTLCSSDQAPTGVTANFNATGCTTYALATLGNLASVAVPVALNPASDATIALDSFAKRYTIGYFSSGIQNGAPCTPVTLGTGTGGICMVESTSSGWAPTSGYDYIRADSTQHWPLVSANATTEEPVAGVNGPIYPGDCALFVSAHEVGDSGTTGCGNALVYKTVSAATNSSISATTMYTNPAPPHFYRFSWVIDQTIAGTGCVGNTTIVLNAVYTDPNSTSTATTLPLGVFTVSGNGAVGNTIGIGSDPIVAKAATVLQYSTVYSVDSSCSAGPTYQVYPRLEFLN